MFVLNIHTHTHTHTHTHAYQGIPTYDPLSDPNMADFYARKFGWTLAGLPAACMPKKISKQNHTQKKIYIKKRAIPSHTHTHTHTHTLSLSLIR